MTPLSSQQAFELALQHHQAGRLTEAAQFYREAIAQNPAHAEAHNNLSLLLMARGQADQAIVECRCAIALAPALAEAHNNLGMALRNQGQHDEAISAFRRAITLRPSFSQAYNNLGATLRDQGHFDEAVAALHQSIQLNPGSAEAHSNLGAALNDKGMFDDAIASFRQALALNPLLPQAAYNLGLILKQQGHLDAAQAAYRQAIALKSDFAEAYNDLGDLLRDTGRLDAAIAAYRQAIAIRPAFAKAHDSLIYTLHFHPDYDAVAMAAERRGWNRQHIDPLPRLAQVRRSDCTPHRRLRIGYLSPDFRNHVVGKSILPLLRESDRAQFEIFCYSQAPADDQLTQQLQRLADRWRNIFALSDEQAAEQIRADGIDILVDLTLHMPNNRLRVFARKPAPVQVTYLGYCGTTGMAAMDYRFSDRFLDPPGAELSLYSEQTIYLEPNYWCYEPPVDSPQASALPAQSAGHITFGCLNNFCKVSLQAMNAWAAILGAVPGSMLLLYAPVGSHRQETIDRFAHAGVQPSRVAFVGNQSFHDYLRSYQKIDVCLDPFPYTGGMTSLDSLWMAVPFVTLAGAQSPVSRGGCSILANVGLTELVAYDRNEYISKVLGLAGDFPRLSELRSTLRRRMQQSPMLDTPGFTRRIESAYHQMWDCRK